MTFPLAPLGNQWTNGEELNSVKMNARVDANLNALIPTFTAFTPTWTNLTVGNGVNVGYYSLIGKILTLQVDFFGGTTSSAATAGIGLTLPAGLVSSSILQQQYIFAIISGAAGFARAGACAIATSATVAALYFPAASTTSGISQWNSWGEAFGSGQRVAVSGQFITS